MTYRVEKWDRPGPPDAAELRAVMTAEGYSVYQWTDRPGLVYAEHRHGDNQSHWIISGILELTVDGAGTFVLEAGDRDLMPAGTVHSARVLGNEPVVYLIGSKID